MDTNIVNKILQDRYDHGADCIFQRSGIKPALSSLFVCLNQTSLCVISRGLIQNEESKIISRCEVSGTAVEPRNL